MIVIMEDVFQFLQPLFRLGFQVAFVEPKKKETGSLMNLEAMNVLRKQQEKFIGAIRKFMFINDLDPFAFKDENHLKICVFIFFGSVVVCFQQPDFEWFMEIPDLHPLILPVFQLKVQIFARNLPELCGTKTLNNEYYRLFTASPGCGYEYAGTRTCEDTENKGL